MYNLIEYIHAYSKTLGGLWQYYWDEPALKNNALFKFQQKITGQTGNGGTKVVEIMVPLKYLSNFWRTLEMSLINCEVILHLKWSKMCYGTVNKKNTSFQITDTKFCVPVVALSHQENIKLLKQLESCSERTINWNKYLATTTN